MCQTRHRTGEILSYGMLLLRLAHLTALLILVRLLPCRALFGCRFLYPVQVGLPEQLIGQSIFRFGQARGGVYSSAGQAPCQCYIQQHIVSDMTGTFRFKLSRLRISAELTSLLIC